MGQTIRFQEILRRLTIIDEGFVEDQAMLGLGLTAVSALDARTAAMLRLGASVAIGAPEVCLEWGAGRALAAGATEDEIAEVLLAIAPVVGLARVVAAAPGVATALGYDITAALEERLLTAPRLATRIGQPAGGRAFKAAGQRLTRARMPEPGASRPCGRNSSRFRPAA